MAEPTDVTYKPEAPSSARDAVTTRTESDPRPESPAAPSAAAAARPTPDEIAAWLQGLEIPAVRALLAGLDAGRLDLLSGPAPAGSPASAAPAGAPLDDLAFHRLPEIGGLRVLYKNQRLARRRIGLLQRGWRQLGGKRPAAWTAEDLFTAVRRLRGEAEEIDLADLLAAIRDVWRGGELPRGREQLETLRRRLALLAESAGG